MPTNINIAAEEATLPTGEILIGDAVEQLSRLPESSVDCVVTSPPYHLLRSYSAGEEELGTATHVQTYVNQIVAVCDEIARVLKPTGTFWLNLGDSFSRHKRYGAPPKSLLLVPERVLLALAAKGWRPRSKVVWAKSNPMPASVRDRLACTWEPLYLLTRSRDYFFDLDAIRVPHRSQRTSRKGDARRRARLAPAWQGPLAGVNDGLDRLKSAGSPGHVLGKNPGDVWTTATSGFRGAHFATFPAALVERPILAGCPPRVCTSCGQPWRRSSARTVGHLAVIGELLPICACRSSWEPGVVLDPFMGSGTTAVVAERHDRRWLGIELNPDFVALAGERITAARHSSTPRRSEPETA